MVMVAPHLRRRHGRAVGEVEHVAAEAGGDARPRRGGLEEHLAQLRLLGPSRHRRRHLMVTAAGKVAPIEVVSSRLRHGGALLLQSSHTLTISPTLQPF
jgi:hypothetical protein